MGVNVFIIRHPKIITIVQLEMYIAKADIFSIVIYKFSY